ncbi:uncharacterized protein LTR77_000589 [Saxophila tyrrhenica]|uniref:F-box domain-containing protein n=1 Tax=Saxophila tyrrhenica TaxID=1690608 RepID=A0AAV9PRS9_9PEZI|nr:hypothetical protein LTR77_000589 [Saxophila tyrrhenica]
MRLKFMISKAMGRMSANNSTFQFPILDLPNELVAHIIEFIDDLNTLRNLACTSHRLQQLTEPKLWREITFRLAPSLLHIVAATESRHERASAVQVLNAPLRPKFGRDMSRLAYLMMIARNLRELMVESPLCNATHLSHFEDHPTWRSMTAQLFMPFQRAVVGNAVEHRPLQKLTKLTLHLNGPGLPYWTPNERSISIFLHPTLKYLNISCVNIPEDLFDEVSERAITPLQHLVLEECNISVRGLHGLLGLPTGLEHLVLGENAHNARQFDNEVEASYNHLFRTNASAVVKALGQQNHSLKSLVYVAASASVFADSQLLRRMAEGRQAGVDAGFADFHALESITSSGANFTFERAVLSSAPPPNLKVLTYQAENAITSPHGSSLQTNADETEMNNRLVALLPFLRAPSASVPASLERLNIVYQRRVQAPVVFTDDKQAHIEKTAKALKAVHGAVLMVGFKGFGQYYPPFLYGEDEPKEKMIFDGESGTFYGLKPGYARLADLTDEDDSDEEWAPINVS